MSVVELVFLKNAFFYVFKMLEVSDYFFVFTFSFRNNLFQLKFTYKMDIHSQDFEEKWTYVIELLEKCSLCKMLKKNRQSVGN